MPLTTGVAVGVMLYALGSGDLAVLAAGVVVSELIVLIAGIPVMFWIEKQLRARGFDLREGGDKERLTQRRKDAKRNPASREAGLPDGPEGIRTPDLLSAIEALSQLSHRPSTENEG